MSRIISNESVKDAKSWRIPDVAHVMDYTHDSYTAGFGGICDQIPTLRDIENMKKNAYDTGFKEGYGDGMEIAKEEFLKKSIATQKIIEKLNDIGAHIDDEVKDELLQLSILIAKHVVRAEISLHPEKIMDAVNEALSILPSIHSSFDIHINPQDLPIVQEFLSLNVEKPGRGWNLIENEEITRGGCKIISDNSCVDGTIENKIAKATAFLMSESSLST